MTSDPAPPVARATTATAMAAGGSVPTRPAAVGRSTLLRGGLAEVGRTRPWILRAAILAGLFGAVGLLVAAIAARALPYGGIGWVVYWLHDTVWLPLRGQFWTAVWPGGLVWLVPVVGITLVVILEFAGIGQPVRRMQVAVIRLGLRLGLGEAICAWDATLRRLGLNAGLITAVVTAAHETARNATLDALAAGGRDIHPDLPWLAVLKLRLDAGDPADRIMAEETLVLGRLAGAAAVAQLEPLAAALGLASAPAEAEPVAATLAAAARLGQSDPAPDAAARETLRVLDRIIADGRPEHMVWFSVWARRRASGQAQRLAEAEALIAFEFWAAEAELHSRAPVAPDPLLAEVLPDVVLARPHGEVHARDGLAPRGVA